ncbi:MAG TPA: di-trans,poly-cis-decaprenylcistransferase [Candidatus Methanofastidiosum sp.]|nr:di-trans,poly-cis-decaprenylcistransferase [Methanofastidiosum sp.]
MFISSLSKNIPHFILGPAYGIYEKKLIGEIKEEKVPHHIGLIMDGNRRYAASKGIPTYLGHEMGMKKAEELLEWANEIGIKIVTLYAFSTENFKRDSEEVNYIMSMLERKFKEASTNKKIIENKVRVKAIGNIAMLPENVKQAIKEGESATERHDNMTLNICVAYGGRMEIIEAIKRILDSCNGGAIDPEEIDTKLLSENLFTKGLPDPDIVIRTGGEVRLSNFLLFQSAYAELFFLNVYFPLIRKIDFLRIIRDFQRRNRRFGR